MHDIDRDYFMTAEEAVTYGLIDGVITPRSGLGFESGGAATPSGLDGA